MSAPLLVELFEKLPQPRPWDDPDMLAAGAEPALAAFRAAVRARYTEGTLQRLLAGGDRVARRAAALGLGFVGTMASNPRLAAALADPDKDVRRIAADALWEVWFRAGTDRQNGRLRAAVAAADAAALDALIADAPDFAEAVNQRAVMRFRAGDYARSAADCERVLALNPHHFGAAAGLGECQRRLNRPRAALRAFRRALDIHPHLDDVRAVVKQLEAALGADGRGSE